MYKEKMYKKYSKEILTPPEVATTKGLMQGISSHTQAESSIYSLKSIIRGTYLTNPIFCSNEWGETNSSINQKGGI